MGWSAPPAAPKGCAVLTRVNKMIISVAFMVNFVVFSVIFDWILISIKFFAGKYHQLPPVPGVQPLCVPGRGLHGRGQDSLPPRMRQVQTVRQGGASAGIIIINNINIIIGRP